MKGRFAPSPSGRMHLGNVCSALLAWLSVRSQNGTMVLRIEDLDTQRCKPQYSKQLIEDLQWLGLDWDEGPFAKQPTGPYYQSRCTSLYESVLESFKQKKMIYPCWCSRAERLEMSAPHGAETPENGCKCKALTETEKKNMYSSRKCAYRLSVPDTVVSIADLRYGIVSQNLKKECGDFLLRRSDGLFAYQLAVTVDDGRMGITEVVRGNDLLMSSPRQAYLLSLMGYEIPLYIHTPLLIAADGKRLSKRDKALDLGELKKKYEPEQLIGMLAYKLGLTEKEIKVTPGELVKDFDWSLIKNNQIII